MPEVGFERTNPAFEWAGTAHASAHAATVINTLKTSNSQMFTIITITNFELSG
jgi:hypothetical protein